MARLSRLEQDGAFIESGVVCDEALSVVRSHFADVPGRPGSRGFSLRDDIAGLVGEDGSLGVLARTLSGGAAKPVRVLFFDKTPETNWSIPWHQDRTIAVRERIDCEGFGPWNMKGGVVHVEPPVALLEGMLTLRLFVDDCDDDNGPLWIAKGSHRHGRLPAAQLGECVKRSEIFVCTGLAGDVLVMKTLAVHCSRVASKPAHRRVLHVDYSAADLPVPLAWKLS